MTSPDDARAKKRFSFTTPMVATFCGTPVTLLDLSQTGAQLAHRDPLEAKVGVLEVEVPGRSVKLALRAEVMWTRREGTQRSSGLRIVEERPDLAPDFLEYLLQLRKVTYDRRSVERKSFSKNAAVQAQDSTVSALQEIDETKPVMQAKEYLDKFPTAAAKWRDFARQSTTEPERVAHSIDVLAVWELLNRSVRLEVVEFVFQLL